MTYDILTYTPEGLFRYYNLTIPQVFHILRLFTDAYGKENVKATIRFF